MVEAVDERERLTSTAFSALDPNLPLTAARAGVQLDNLIAGRQSKIDALRDLSCLLQNYFSAPAPGGGEKSSFDPVSVNIFSNAYSAFSHDAKLRTRGDLSNALLLLNTAMTKAVETAAPDGLEALRDFCVALSEYSSLKRRALLGRNRPSNPNKRVIC